VNYIADEELATLRRLGHYVAYCPAAHAFFGHEQHPRPRLLAAGVPTVVGTDSAASTRNTRLSILDELRMLAGDPATLLRTATLGAAAALGLDGAIGSLSPGKFADIAVFPATGEVGPDLIMQSPAARAVYVAGRRWPVEG
jgi:cytosine/adenosine deaminase-related metal-dependent hydrolase